MLSCTHAMNKWATCPNRIHSSSGLTSQQVFEETLSLFSLNQSTYISNGPNTCFSSSAICIPTWIFFHQVRNSSTSIRGLKNILKNFLLRNHTLHKMYGLSNSKSRIGGRESHAIVSQYNTNLVFRRGISSKLCISPKGLAPPKDLSVRSFDKNTLDFFSSWSIEEPGYRSGIVLWAGKSYRALQKNWFIIMKSTSRTNLMGISCMCLKYMLKAKFQSSQRWSSFFFFFPHLTCY